ncbi:MAG: hypothetical protein HZB40_16665 [Rhodocyclales bacterium]|nr:hypothetical protein [Rhodocyclales bacterium]
MSPDERRAELALHTHLYLDELAFVLGISEDDVPRLEAIGALPPSGPDFLLGSARRRWPREEALKRYAAHLFQPEQQRINNAIARDVAHAAIEKAKGATDGST